SALLNTLSIFILYFNDTAPTQIYTLSLHDALPISPIRHKKRMRGGRACQGPESRGRTVAGTPACPAFAGAEPGTNAGRAGRKGWPCGTRPQGGVYFASPRGAVARAPVFSGRAPRDLP